MGCDIHMVLERRLPDREWIGLWSSDAFPLGGGRPLVARRDYEFFAEVAGVRGNTRTSLYPKNLPEDVSRLSWVQYMRSPTDHHSVSHLSADDFVAAYKRANPEGRHGYRPEFALYDLLGVDPDWPENADYRVVFWFDN